MIDDTCSPENVINNILKTPIFTQGELYQILLRYLFQCYQQNYIPTEIDIAINVFGKKDDFDPTEDTLVRVYLYRLRKKLEKYYSDTGKCDKIRISIPKGQHLIEFIPNENYVEGKEKKLFKIRNLLIISSFSLLIFLLGLLWIQNRSLQKKLMPSNNLNKDTLIWSDFLTSDLKTLFVIGELFSFYKYDDKYDRTWLIRDDRINSKGDLDNFIDQHKLNKENIYLPSWDIIPKSAAINLSKLQPLFHSRERSIQLKITSEVTWDDIENHNIIFIGHTHNLGIFNNVLPINRIQPIVKWTPGKEDPEIIIHVHDDALDTLYYCEIYQRIERPANLDYVIILKIPGPNRNSLLFIISFFTIGRLEIIEIITDVNLLSQMEENILSTHKRIPKYFEMLFEIKGFKEIGLKTELKHFFKLSSEFQIIE